MTRSVLVIAVVFAAILPGGIGCDKVSQMSDENKMAGKWNGPMGQRWEFYSNGDARFHGTFSNNRGKWKILTGQRLEIRWEDAIIEPLQEFKYSFKGKNLILTGTNLAYELEPQ